VQDRFGTTSSYTVGEEEEFQLVSPSTLQLTPVVEDVVGAIPDGSERLARELFQDCVEMRTPVCSTVSEVARDLPMLRGEVTKAANEAGVGIAAAGMHPTSDPFSQRCTRWEC
jgi:carboxylate-amine ligase